MKIKSIVLSIPIFFCLVPFLMATPMEYSITATFGDIQINGEYIPGYTTFKVNAFYDSTNVVTVPVGHWGGFTQSVPVDLWEIKDSAGEVIYKKSDNGEIEYHNEDPTLIGWASGEAEGLHFWHELPASGLNLLTPCDSYFGEMSLNVTGSSLGDIVTFAYSGWGNVTISSAPEPSIILLLGIGLLSIMGIGIWRRLYK